MLVLSCGRGFARCFIFGSLVWVVCFSGFGGIGFLVLGFDVC